MIILGCIGLAILIETLVLLFMWLCFWLTENKKGEHMFKKILKSIKVTGEFLAPINWKDFIKKIKDIWK